MCPTLIQRDGITLGHVVDSETLPTSGVTDLSTVQEHSAFLDEEGERVLMLEQAITELQNIEQWVARKAFGSTNSFGLTRRLKELRALSVVCPRRAEQSATDRRPGSSS